MTALARRLARPEILELPSAGSLVGGADAYQPDIVRLHLNENGQAPLIQGSELGALNRYPEPHAPPLRRQLAALYAVAPECLVATRGADDAIDILIRTFCRAGRDAIAMSTPSFGAYPLFAKIQGAGVVEIPLAPDFAFDAAAYVAAVKARPEVRLAFICSPNNPTGNVVPPAEILRVADALTETIIVLDEAYIEFAEIESLAEEATRRDNLVVLRTLSKAWGLAGARVGCAIGNAELIDIVSRALPPFPLACGSIAAAQAILAPSRRLVHAERLARLKSERARMAERLAASPIVRRIWPSEANFLLLEVDDVDAARKRFDQSGIRVRYRPDIAAGAVRLTIGTEQENALALAAFGVDPGAAPARRAEAVRDTKETRIAAAIDLDRASPRRIDTGIPFFDHMLDQVAAHGGFSLVLGCDGDLEIDAHHSLEDVAITFGRALAGALGDRRGIGRFGFALPMDEAEANVLIDLSGRPFARFEGAFAAGHIGAYPTEMTPHIFRSIADSLGAAIHVQVTGDNDHHKTEACFKAFGRALRQAIAVEKGAAVPSTKGVL